MKILLIEDNVETAECLSRILNMHGHDTRIILTGVEALSIAKIGPWAEAIVLDHYLPGMDGISFLQELRQLPDWSTVPVILATGLDRDQANVVIRQAPGPGTVHLLVKPFDPLHLLAMLGDL